VRNVRSVVTGKCGLIDRFLANHPKRRKFYSKGLNKIDRRIDEA
jgi:hypothetical protein